MSKREISNIEPFNDIWFNGNLPNCLYSALFPIVNHYVGSLDPFLLNGVYLYEYSNNEGNTSIDLKLQEFIDVFKLCSTLGIHVKPKLISTDIINDIIASVDNMNPVIIFIDCFYESIRKDTYQKIHWSHALLIYGYDSQKEIFNVLEHDYNENLTYLKREISFSDIFSSYKGYLENFGSLNNYTFIEFSKCFEDSQKSYGTEKHVTSFIDNILLKKEEIINSLDYIKKFTEDIHPLLLSESISQTDMDNIINGFNNIINNKKSSIYIFKKVFGNDPTILNHHNDIINSWNFIRSVFLKYRFSSMRSTKYFEACITRLMQVYEFEKSYHEFYFQFLDSKKNC